MSLYNRLKAKIRYELLKLFKPEMIGYSTDILGNRFTDLRISNTTHVSNQKNVKFSNNVFIGHFSYIDGFDKVSIGTGSQITNYVSILTHSSHNSIRLYGEHYIENCNGDMEGLVTAPVEIGEYCFIGPHSVIMPGTVLGKGCIVSAFSFVSGKFDNYSVIRGIPAKVVGNTTEIDEEFLKQSPHLKNLYFNKEA
jgi:acetyltransferase-like isoleucine patch superfamily enzyme